MKCERSKEWWLAKARREGDASIGAGLLARDPALSLELDEAERQMLLLALAHLSVERPGWDDALNRIACKIDNITDGRAVLYEEFASLRRDQSSL
jgi:hypothetical protein